MLAYLCRKAQRAVVQPPTSAIINIAGRIVGIRARTVRTLTTACSPSIAALLLATRITTSRLDSAEHLNKGVVYDYQRPN